MQDLQLRHKPASDLHNAISTILNPFNLFKMTTKDWTRRQVVLDPMSEEYIWGTTQITTKDYGLCVPKPKSYSTKNRILMPISIIRHVGP